ncbi:MAG: Gldg family protein [Pseudomonadota bacterium]
MFSSKEKYLKFIVYIIVIILINIVGITLFLRIDLTRGKIYSLSTASQEVVATLSEPLSIKVFFSKDLPAPHNNTERYLKDLLEEYASKGGKLFNYTFYNVTPDEGAVMQNSDKNRDMARNYGIDPIQIQIMENDEVKFKNAYMGLIIIHGDLIEKIQTITSTNGLEYQLTAAIQKMNNKVSALHRLDKKIKLSMYLSESLNQVAPLIGLNQLPMLGQAIADKVENLNRKNLGVLDFNHIPIPNKQQFDELAQKYDLMALSWPAVPGKQIPAGFGAAGLVIEFDGQFTTLPLIHAMEIPIIGTSYQMADPNALEDQINSVMEKMIGINKDIGFLSSHDALSLTPDQAALMQGRQDDSLKAFNNLISSRYTVKNIDLKKGAIPDGLNCLIIARPTQTFSDYELFQIDQALMKGTNIAFISDAFKQISIPQGGRGMPPIFNPIDTGLEKLLAHYGVAMQKGYILDEQCYQAQVPPNMGGGEQNLYFAPILKNESINTKPDFMNNIKALVTMQAAPIELINENIDSNKVKVVKLLSSSKKSWLMDKNISLNPTMIHPPAEEEAFSSYTLAYMLNGSFTSFFKGKAIPQKTIDPKTTDPDTITQETIKDTTTLKEVQAKNTIIETGKPAKLFILASSQMIQDTIIDPEGRTSNSIFILNAIDHLNNEDKIATLRAKQQTLNPIEETSPSLRAIIKGFNIVGLPVLVILFGLGVLAKRTSRKKKLTARFNA